MAMDGYRGFLGLLVSALLVGFLSVICTLVWVLHYREGLGWDGTGLQFNWHPVLTVTGFVFIQGLGNRAPRGAGRASALERGARRQSLGELPATTPEGAQNPLWGEEGLWVCLLQD